MRTYRRRPGRGPGYVAQGSLRTVFRVVGVVAMTSAVVLIALAAADFLQVFNSDNFDTSPTKLWMFFVAVPLFAVGGFCLQAGFLGAGARYAAGEAMPVVRDSVDYLRADDKGPTCDMCAARNQAGARFCHACGAALGGT